MRRIESPEVADVGVVQEPVNGRCREGLGHDLVKAGRVHRGHVADGPGPGGESRTNPRAHAVVEL